MRVSRLAAIALTTALAAPFGVPRGVAQDYDEAVTNDTAAPVRGSMAHRFDSDDVRVVLQGYWQGRAGSVRRYDFNRYELDILSDVGLLRPRELAALMEQGTTDLDAQHKIARLLLFGGGRVSADPREAVVWLSRAAARGHALSQNDLACLYLVGRGTPQNFNRAFDWFLRSAKLGAEEGQLGVALCHRFGLGTPLSTAKARAYMERALRQRLYTAELMLAFEYLVGRIVPVDERRAYELLSLAYADGGTRLLDRRGLDVLQSILLRRLSDTEIRISQTQSNIDFREERTEKVTIIGPAE